MQNTCESMFGIQKQKKNFKNIANRIAKLQKMGPHLL